MVKRPKSPEPIEDSKMLAVVHPYPLNANMELVNDFTEFMYWLASVVGKDYALGVFYIPSARGMVVAEVSKEFKQFDKLLGEHRWGEFLREPSPEERDRKTKVYNSTYTNSRALQKDGWKYMLADDELFSNFRPINKKVKHPYPPTRWCEPHYENPTSKPVCKPLPIATKAPPQRAPTVVQVPGSSTWINRKSGLQGTPGTPSIESKGGSSFKGSSQAGGSKGKAKAAINPDAWKTPITPTATTSSPMPSSLSVKPQKTAWTKPLTSTSMSIPETTMSTPRSTSPASALAGTELDSRSTSPLLSSEPYELFDDSPPGLRPPGLSPFLPKGKPTNPVGSSSISILQRQFASSSISSDTNSIAATVSESGYLDDYDDDSEGSDSFEFPTADVISVRDEVEYDPRSAPRMGKGPGKGRRGQGNVDTDFSFSKNQKDNSASASKVLPQYTTRTFRKVVEEEDLCPVHGIICSKGICSVMKKKKWDKDREEKKKKREISRERRKRYKEGGDQPELDERGNVVDDSEAQEDESCTEVEGEVVDEVESVVRSAPSVAGSKSSANGSKKSESGHASTVASGIKGDWGPKKARNTKQKSFLPEESSKAPALSQVKSSTDNGSLYGSHASSSRRSTPGPESTTRMRPTPMPQIHTTKSPPPSKWGKSSKSSTAPFSSRGAAAPIFTGSSGNAAAMMPKGGSAFTSPTTPTSTTMDANAWKGKGNEKWKGPFEPTAPAIRVRPNEQGRKKTWDEMVEENESELGSIMDFSGR
ncbi:hypothetical protein AGABI1DRAFT_109101 [Agaricus bisporus var. burnettii JB137-S8]|uniref:Uncharacterized protein n=1 Tax=Agaricus bisporus var. burnettii (strain JB137-S8 / ATCC MYA-4627 / FGSC 10392) TaxID=597362 RepID=K5VNH8_AGABU|nr:uncharacterized protein AGABI1DRAFT_109101 [Agaricus bisporus var. burnettii JB137-S8]EKM76019.1 hypothetical protein AGABI1DRAFT_109101 [Agaricus bisporus var. burnettii JB137-S8]